MNTQDKTTQKASAPETRIKVGGRVRCNEVFAPAFVGQTGTIVETWSGPFGELWKIELDIPTAAARGFSKVEHLAAGADAYDIIPSRKAAQ